MAVDAIELRPRGPVLLFDAAIRLCARSTGVWSLLLLSGAFTTWAVFNGVEVHAAARGYLASGSLVLPLDRLIEDGRCVERSLHAGSGVRVVAVDQAGDGIGLREAKARADVLYGVTGLR